MKINYTDAVGQTQTHNLDVDNDAIIYKDDDGQTIITVTRISKKEINIVVEGLIISLEPKMYNTIGKHWFKKNLGI